MIPVRFTAKLGCGAGSFNQDARGRWYLNCPIKVECANYAQVTRVGIDLGLKKFATLSTGETIITPQFYRKSEAKLASAQRARKIPKRIRTIHAKVANRRKDFLHKASTKIANKFGFIVIGDVSPKKLAKTRMAKSVAMARTLPEWIGRTPDSIPPPRVKLRVFQKYDGRCGCHYSCLRKIRPGEAWDCDHKIALINGGLNRESNLRPVLRSHHEAKTASDLADKSKVYAMARKHVGPQDAPSRPMPCGRDSGFKKTMRGAVVERVRETHEAMMKRRFGR